MSTPAQNSFVGDEVNAIIKEGIDNVLTQVSYEHQKVRLDIHLSLPCERSLPPLQTQSHSTQGWDRHRVHSTVIYAAPACVVRGVPEGSPSVLPRVVS